MALAVHGSYLFAAIRNTDYVPVYDAATLAPVRHISFPGWSTFIPSLAASSSCPYLYVADAGNNEIFCIEPQSGNLITSWYVDAGCSTTAISVDKSCTVTVACPSREIRQFTASGSSMTSLFIPEVSSEFQTLVYAISSQVTYSCT